MDIILYFIRDTISGTFYFIYAFILFILMFAMIGYLLKTKYAKLNIKFSTSQNSKNNEDVKTNIDLNKVKDNGNNKSLETITNSNKIDNKINNNISNLENFEPAKKVNPEPMPNQNLNEVIIPEPMPNLKTNFDATIEKTTQVKPKIQILTDEQNLKLNESIPELKL